MTEKEPNPNSSFPSSVVNGLEKYANNYVLVNKPSSKNLIMARVVFQEIGLPFDYQGGLVLDEVSLDILSRSVIDPTLN